MRHVVTVSFIHEMQIKSNQPSWVDEESHSLADCTLEKLVRKATKGRHECRSCVWGGESEWQKAAPAAAAAVAVVEQGAAEDQGAPSVCARAHGCVYVHSPHLHLSL